MPAGQVALQSHHGHHLRADRDRYDFVNLVPHCRKFEKWVIHELGGNQVAISSKWGRWLTGRPCGGVQQTCHRESNSIWTRVALPGGRFAFLGAHGRYLNSTEIPLGC